MDKNVLKKFAIESRQELMEKVANKINRYFVDEEFNVNQNGEVYVLVNDKHTLRLTKNEYENRQLLVKRIKEITLEQVIEEASYTWFNRIIAIRYMEIHDYLPLTKDNQSLGVRVLSSKDNTPDPEIMKISNLINPDLDIEFNKEYYGSIQDNNKRFEYILLLVCKKLGKVIPQVFDGITDYIDILVPDNLLNESGYVTKLLNDVAEENFEQVEIIGWLYQYYNQSEKDRVISAKKAYKKNEIPFATQLFTPDWIVKYMVENSLGRYWLEHGGNSKLIEKWDYYVETEITKVKEKIDPKSIKCIDPCSGSGHILVYIFEILFQIYESYGYSKKDIAKFILENNLFGLDIDDRAGQLSILSVILKAREYDKDIFNSCIISKLNIMNVQESNSINKNDLDIITDEKNDDTHSVIEYVYDVFQNAKEVGSLLKVKNNDYDDILKKIASINNKQLNIFEIEKVKNINNQFIPLVKVAKTLSNKYDIVITNPPYLGQNSMNNYIKEFLNKYYSEGKYDLCTAFMQVEFVKNDGYLAMINQQAWMFKKVYKNIRKYLLNNYTIYNMAHMGMGAFGTDFGTTCWIAKKGIIEKSYFIRLAEHRSLEEKEKIFFEIIKHKEYIMVKQENLYELPNHIFAYWITPKMLEIFKTFKPISDYLYPKKGFSSGDNDRFLRLWYEINFDKLNQKWIPITMGGDYRRWYGNTENVVNYDNDGFELKNFHGSVMRNVDYYFKNCISWNDTSSSGKIAMRYHDYGTIPNASGPCIYGNDEELKFALGLMNSIVAEKIMSYIAPALKFEVGEISNMPYRTEKNSNVINLVNENIKIAKEDWDSFEMSWEFKKHPLVPYGITSKDGLYIEASYKSWQELCNEHFNELKHNEEQLNTIFIDIYELQKELNFEIEDKDITIRKADKERDIKSLISYAVGCMFGRYSLDKEGLVYAGGKFEELFEKYKGQSLTDDKGQPLAGNNGGWAGVSLADYKYINDGKNEVKLSYSPDIDNIIPLTEENYFGDDIVSRFKKFIEVVYGKDTLYENLEFIAETLGKKNGENSEETIRRYFINDFYNEHVKMYQKRPIYWLFDSGKRNGFKCLIYMHRYNEGLVSKIRLDYLHRMQNTYEKELKEISDKLNDDVDLTSKRELSKRQADISAKLQETNEYDEKIAHIADQKIKIDLDDGVVVNYAKFSVKNPKTGKNESILAKIK